MHPRMVTGTVDIKVVRERFAEATNAHTGSVVVNKLILALLNEMRSHIKEVKIDAP